MRAPGVTPIMTLDPENIKAILATQFNDFGKGEEFHNAWSMVPAGPLPIFPPVLGRRPLADGSFWETESSMPTAISGVTPARFFDHNFIVNE